MKNISRLLEEGEEQIEEIENSAERGLEEAEEFGRKKFDDLREKALEEERELRAQFHM